MLDHETVLVDTEEGDLVVVKSRVIDAAGDDQVDLGAKQTSHAVVVQPTRSTEMEELGVVVITEKWRRKCHGTGVMAGMTTFLECFAIYGFVNFAFISNELAPKRDAECPSVSKDHWRTERKEERSRIVHKDAPANIPDAKVRFTGPTGISLLVPIDERGNAMLSKDHVRSPCRLRIQLLAGEKVLATENMAVSNR